MKIKILRKKFFISTMTLLICIGMTYFIARTHRNYNAKSACEIDVLQSRNAKLKKDLRALNRGSNYTEFINLLKEVPNPHGILKKISTQDTLKILLQEIAQDFRIDDAKINVGNFHIIDTFSLYDWKIEYTNSKISININTLLEEQMLFVVKRIEDLFVRGDKLYNIVFDKIVIKRDIDPEYVGQDVQKPNKIATIDLNFYFFNVIGGDLGQNL